MQIDQCPFLTVNIRKKVIIHIRNMMTKLLKSFKDPQSFSRILSLHISIPVEHKLEDPFLVSSYKSMITNLKPTQSWDKADTYLS